MHNDALRAMMYAHQQKGAHMPRVTVYVPDDLKAVMDDAGEAVNWSSVAQQAFRHAVLSNNVRRNNSMTNVIARLRASKAEASTEEFEHGKEAGRQWAEERASFKELSYLAESAAQARADTPPIDTLRTMVSYSDGSHDLVSWDDTEVWLIESSALATLPGNGQPTHEQIAGFVRGALDVWEEASPHI